MSKALSSIPLLCLIAAIALAGDMDEADFYKGSYAPDGDYILSGGLIKDLPPPIEIPAHYEAPGFDGSRLSKVPPAGIHPRIIISPSDVERFKELHAAGDKAPRIFRLQMEQMRRDAEKWKIPANFNYRGSPWGEDSKIAGWGLYALITEDQELGRKAAEATVQHALYMEGRIDILNTHPDSQAIKDVAYDFIRTGVKFGQVDYHSAYYQGGRERVEALMKEHGATIAKTGDHSGSYLTLAFEYDYAHPFMTEEQRAIVRRVISKCTYGKYATGMALPGQMYINNHMSGSANQIYLALAIEGEEGYDPRVAKLAEWSLTNKLSYDLSSDGITYENTKGFIPMLPVLAVARRQGADHPQNLLKHSHLLARANSNVQHARKLYYRYFGESRRRPDGKRLDTIITGFDEERYWRASGGSGSGGHLEFWSVLKHFYPDNEMVDFVWNCKLPGSLSYYEGTPEDNWRGKIHHWWFNLKAINLLTATHLTDYNKLDKLEQFAEVEKFWFDDERGIMSARNDWSADSMLVHQENRIDQYYMGHESPQHGDFQVWADGIPWIPNGGGYLDTSFRNMVLVDGLAGVYAPISGDWMSASGTEHTATAVSEMTSAYQWRKSWNGLRYLDHPGLKTAPYQMGGRFLNAAYQLNRFSELAYLPRIREHYDGFAHLDWGPWHGETRGPEYYIKWNDPMDHVFRTLHFARSTTSTGSGQAGSGQARGERPYLLIMDDLRKADDNDHQFDWRMLVTGDAVVHTVSTATGNRHTEHGTEGAIGTDLVFSMGDDNYRRGTGSAWGAKYLLMKPKPKKGDPMLLVRVLWRNTNFPYPVPNVQRSGSFQMVSVPAFGKSPEYRVMVFPHRFGDKLPSTEWSDDRSRLTIKVGGNVDVYDFDQTDRERTVFTMGRNGKKVTDSGARPPRPRLIERARFTVDQNRPDWRPARIISGATQVRFAPGKPGAQIRYTLDGSEPDADSPRYSRAITIDRTCTLKARTYRPDWRFGEDNWSNTTEFAFQLQQPQPAVELAGAVPGLRVSGYEIKTTEFDRKGFFQGRKKSLPDLSRHQPLVTQAVPDFTIPVMNGKAEAKRMMKAFYAFDSFLAVPETGVYSFELSSCGPVDFQVAGQQVIGVDEQFGLSYKPRYGEIALEKGWHPLHLVVCDPVFWKGDTEEHYAISLKALAPSGDAYRRIDATQLKRKADGLQIAGDSQGEVTSRPAAEGVKVVPGLIQRRCDRLDYLLAGLDSSPNYRSEAQFIPTDGLPPAYFEAAKLEPYHTSIVEVMERNDSPRKLVEYRGYIRIDRDGLYTFSLKEGREDAARLLIDGQVVVRRQIDAPKTDGKIALAAGLHAFSLQIAMGQAVVSMKHADDADFQIVHPGALARDDAYQPPKAQQAAGGGIPTAGLIGLINGETIDGETTPVLHGGGAVAIVEGGEVIPDGVKGKALGLYGPSAGIKLRGLKQREDAFSISCWVKFKDRPQDINVWGQAYGSLTLRVRGNRLVADWSRGVGVIDVRVDKKLVQPDQWFHVAATYGKENAVYFNGELVGTAQSLHFSSRRANGFFADHQAVSCSNKPTAIDEFRFYDRALRAEEIKAIFEGERNSNR